VKSEEAIKEQQVDVGQNLESVDKEAIVMQLLGGVENFGMRKKAEEIVNKIPLLVWKGLMKRGFINNEGAIRIFGLQGIFDAEGDVFVDEPHEPKQDYDSVLEHNLGKDEGGYAWIYRYRYTNTFKTRAGYNKYGGPDETSFYETTGDDQYVAKLDTDGNQLGLFDIQQFRYYSYE